MIWCSSHGVLGLNLSHHSPCVPWAGNITLLARNKTWVVVLGTPGRKSWRWPPTGHLLSRRKEKVLLFYVHGNGAMLVHCTLNTPTSLAVELSPRDLSILGLTSGETPDAGVHPGPLPFSTLQHLFAAVAKPSLPFIPICSLQRLLVFPSVAFFFFTCDLIHTNSFLF